MSLSSHPWGARRLIFSALAAVVLAGCASDEERFEQHRANAQAFLEAGKQKEALIELRSALKLQPKDAETNYQLGTVLEEAQNLVDAIFFYREAIRLDPSHTDAMLRESKLLLQDDPDRAEELVNALLEQSPQDYRAHIRHAELALVRVDSARALAAALTATELAPDNPHPYHQLGIVHEARIHEARLLGESVDDELFEAALHAFAKAAEKASDRPAAVVEARLQRAKVYGSWPGHREETAEAFREAVKAAQDQGIPRVVAGIGRAVIDYAESTKQVELRNWALRQTIEAQPGFIDGWAQLAAIEDSEGRSGEAVFRELLAKRPGDGNAHVGFALYLSGRGRTDDALAHLEEAAELVGNPAFILAAKAAFERSQGRLDESRATLARLQREHPDDPSAIIALAQHHLARGRPARAAAQLRDLSATHETTQVYRWLAEAELARRDLPAATDAVNRALSLLTGAPERRETLLRLKARIAFQSEDWPTVIQIYRRLANSGRELNSSARLQWAISLYEVGQDALGRRMLEGVLATENPPSGAVTAYARREGETNPQRAYELLTAAHQRAPTNLAILRELTNADLKAGRPGLALQRLNQTIEGRRITPRLLLIRAELLAGVGQLEAAERDALQAFEAAPQLSQAVNLLVSIYIAQDKLDEALASFAEAEEAGVLHAGARALLGQLYLRTGDPARAEEMYEKALAERSDLPSAKNNLAFLLARDGRDLDRALRLAREAHQAMDESPATADTLGYVYYRKGLHEAAARQFRYALGSSSDPVRPDYYYHLGLALRSLGQNEEAVEAFEAALRVDGNFTEAEEVRRQIEDLRAQSTSEAGSS